MKKTIIILIYLFCFGTVFGQDLYLNCEESKIPCDNGGKDHFEPITFCPYIEYSDTNKIPQAIRDVNQKYLTNRLGEQFIKRVIFRNVVVIEPDRYDQIKKTKGWISEDGCNDKVKYAFEYYFIIQDSMNFYFTTVYDIEGQMLSKPQLPDINKNKTFDSIIDVCQAKQVAEIDKKYEGKLKGVSLEYSESENSFVWEIEKPGIRKGKKITTPFVIINAQTGKIIGYRTEKGIIVCELPSF